MLIKYIHVVESSLSNVPIVAGQYIVVTDTKDAYFDTKDGERIKLSDFMILDTDKDREGLLAPISGKFYFTKDDGALWYYDSEWIKIIANIDTSKLLTKEDYKGSADGIVKKADEAITITGMESAPLFSVWGKSPEGKEGYYEFPIGYIDDQTNKFQSVRQNAKANEVYTVELISPNKLNDLIIQAYEFTQGDQDIVTTLKEFNNKDANNFYYDKDNLAFTEEGVKIKNEYEVMSTKNEDTGFYELDLSKEGFISDIENISVEAVG